MKLPTCRHHKIYLLLAVVLLSFTYTAMVAASIKNSRSGTEFVAVILYDDTVNVTRVQEGFKRFLQLFQFELKDTKVDFLYASGFDNFVKHLQNAKYSTIVSVVTSNDVGHVRGAAGSCRFSEDFSKGSAKTILLWPCPKMKESNNILPSFEAISFAVKSVSMKLNWTEAIVLASDGNWGLPLAIAANLHIPYRLEIGTKHLSDLQISDKIGKAIIVTSSLTDTITLDIIKHFSSFNHTKILLIDVLASSFNPNNTFYKSLMGISSQSKLMTNLLVLAILSDKYRYFLNLAYRDTGTETLQTFARLKGIQLAENVLRPSGTNIDFGDFLSNLKTETKCPMVGGMEAAIITAADRRIWCERLLRNLQNCSRTQAAHMKFYKIFAEIESVCEISAVRNSDLQKFVKQKHHNNVLVLKDVMEFFSLYDFIVSNVQRTINGAPKFDFVVIDFLRNISNTSNMNNSFVWRPFIILEQSEINLKLYTSHPIPPGYNDWLLDGTVAFWHCGILCWLIIVVSIVFLILIVGASVAAGIGVRNYLLRKRLSKGPNKIVLSADDFVFPVDSRRVDEGIEAMLCCWLQQLQEFGGPEVDKPDLLKGSIGSLKNLGLAAAGKNNSGSGSLARHNTTIVDMRARYNGDLVQLKEILMGNSVELKSKAMDLLVIAHGLRHENINPLIGWLSDPNRSAMVFDYCSRGSLQDVLIMDEIKLDWSFRLSLLTDLVRGMRYLHSSPIRVHGALTSRNCVVDARWVLKITDYGLPTFYEAQGLSLPHKNPKELLWTAPELLRNSRGHNKSGTQMADVYAFGIIMQEVVVRGEPYCMLSLSPEEIIVKIKKPPPLIRPSVSKGAAPPEAINIMRQCWAEMPDMRPDFNSVYERFKQLNHGRKVNFVDTMFQMLEKYSNNLEELIRERTEQLDIERKKTEQLLNRMLPSSVAEKLKMGQCVEPEEFSDVTIYFSDIVGFTTIAAHCSPVQVVDLLNDLYTIFDATINAYNVYKVETIGDAYMVVSGLPVRIPDHAEQIATMALDLLHQSGTFKVKHLPGVPLQLRIGLHTGPCCAGVVGLTMPRYCLFGDTVNTASRMESTGSSWRVHMSEATRDRLEFAGGYDIDSRGPIDIKGKGIMKTYWLLGKKGFDKPLPTPPPIGLDESLIRNSIISKAQANKSRNSGTNPSSSQSSSLAGESVEVKVEITPPSNTDTSSVLPNAFSIDTSPSLVVNLNAIGELTAKVSGSSPQQRKLSELSQDGLLNPANFNRLNPSSQGGSSSRLYKKIEEMIDLSSPYNHYKCLSPSESNLSQFADGKFLYSNMKIDSKPGSSRLLRRQFSLDKDDGSQQNQTKQALEVPVLQENKCSPTSICKSQLPRMLKQTSTSIAQDLEKIEEIPLSPASSQHHSSLESTINRSPPINSATTTFGERGKGRAREINLNVEALLSR